jgi:HEAT repeats
MFLRDTTEAIWAFTGTVLGLIFCIGIASILRQIRHNSAGSSQADKWENATDAVVGFIDGDEPRMARFSRLLNDVETRPIVIEALSNVSRTSPDCAVRLRDRDADVAILRQWVSDALEDKDAGRRAHACEVVGTLRLRACRGMVLAATGDEDVNVKVSATRAMAVIDPESAVGVLLGLIEEEGTWAADLLADLLQRIPGSAREAVVLRAREWGATPALVKLLASSPSLLANDVLLGALETNDAELRARTAEAIHASSPEAVAGLCALLTDPHEGTRLSAVRSLSRASNPDALLTLSSALSDSSRLVRFAAAAGIAGTPGGGEVLQRVLTGSDGNASEAAELALWRLNSVVLKEELLPSIVEPSLATFAPSVINLVSEPTELSLPIKVEEPADEPSDERSDERSDVLELLDGSKPSGPKRSGPKPRASKPSTPKPLVNECSAHEPAVTKSLVPEPAVTKFPAPKHPVPQVERRDRKGEGSPGNTVKLPLRRSAEVMAWLETFLEAHDGVASAPLVKAAAAREGIAERTLERVRPMIATSKRQGFGEAANWELHPERRLIRA